MPAARILVVENESIVALHIQRQLQQLGYDVPNPVGSGEQALRRIETARPDLILMDIHLDGELDGIATAALIQPDPRIPIIYLTAYSEDATLARASATSPDGYLLKPFTEREVHATIQMALARGRSEAASREAQERRRQAEKMAALGKLAAGLADGFDDFLKVIYTQLETLGGQAIDHPDLAGSIEQAFGEAIEKEKLVRQLLAFSGRQRLTPDNVSVAGLIANATRQLGVILGPSISIRTDLPPTLWAVRADRGSLGNALTNLAKNAREAMPEGGRLTIAARNVDPETEETGAGVEGMSGRHVLLTVSDTGMGMPRHVVERAFEPFFTTKAAADGLGLSLVFGFVRQSGGHIGIDSQPRGGTTVRLWLPAVMGPEHPAPAPEKAEAAGLEWRHEAAKRDAYAARPIASSKAMAPFPVAWCKSDKLLFASVQQTAGEVLYRLVVEPLPNRNGWDWTVWRPVDDEKAPRHGRATSLVFAMAAAEDAARTWNALRTACR